MSRSVSASLMSRHGGVYETDWANRILDVWRATAPCCIPERLGGKPIGDRITFPLLETLTHGWQATRAKPSMHVEFLPGTQGRPSDLSLWGGPATPETVEQIMQLTTALLDVLKAHHAFVHAYEGPPIRLNHIQSHVAGLPPLYWWNYFGPLYVDLIGADVLERAPAFRVERMGEGYLLQLTEMPPGRATASLFLQVAHEVMTWLGRSNFRDPPDGLVHRPDLAPYDLLTAQGLPFSFYDANVDQVPLLQASIDRASLLLAKAETFDVFGIGMGLGGQLELVQGGDSDSRVVGDARAGLVTHFRDLVREGSLRGCAIVTEGPRSGGKPAAVSEAPYRRAISVHLEHKNASAAMFTLPYRRVGDEIELAMPPGGTWAYKTYWRNRHSEVFHLPDSWPVGLD